MGVPVIWGMLARPECQSCIYAMPPLAWMAEAIFFQPGIWEGRKRPGTPGMAFDWEFEALVQVLVREAECVALLDKFKTEPWAFLSLRSNAT